jgi:hypothetical protein
MNPDPEMVKALESCEFPVLGIAKLLDALSAEFLALEADPQQKLLREPYFAAAFNAIQALASSYTKIVESRGGPPVVH